MSVYFYFLGINFQNELNEDFRNPLIKPLILDKKLNSRNKLELLNVISESLKDCFLTKGANELEKCKLIRLFTLEPYLEKNGIVRKSDNISDTQFFIQHNEKFDKRYQYEDSDEFVMDVFSGKFNSINRNEKLVYLPNLLIEYDEYSDFKEALKQFE